ncbi:MAG: DUF445 family protein [Gemmatimonadota bacterium]
MNDVLVRILLGMAFGAMAGGLTNSLAVWMLFHPYEPPRFLGIRFGFLQGAIPKNQGRMAGAIGRTVGTKLLTGEDLGRTLSEPSFRAAFDERLAVFVAAVFESRRGSLEEMLPPELAAELRALLDDVAEHLLERLDEYLDGEEFHAAAHRWAEKLAAEMRERPLAELLTPEREEAIVGAAGTWLVEAVEGEDFADAVHDYLDRGTTRLLRPGRTFQDLLPAGMVAAVERGIAGYLPMALERLGRMLEDPQARKVVEKALHEILDRFMKDLKFHQRIFAAFIITPDTVDRVLAAIEQEGAGKIADLLRDDAVRDAMARGVNGAIVDFLEKPVSEVLGEPGTPAVEDAKATAQTWVLTMARDEQTRAFLVEKLRASLTAAERRTWGDLLRHIPPERMADAVVAAARSERAALFYREGAERAVNAVLTRPLGRLADHIPPTAPTRVEGALAQPLWRWLQEQVPGIAARVDIAAKVEQNIDDFPMEKVEHLIRSVTDRELKLIVKLGYVLGAFIGLASALLAGMV